MRFLILNTDYLGFLEWLYSQDADLAGRPYDEQMRVRNESLFGVADFYSRNLRRLGHEAVEIHLNNEAMQRAWAREQGLSLPAGQSTASSPHPRSGKLRKLFRTTPGRTLRRVMEPFVRRFRRRTWLSRVLSAQVQHFRPDVILNQAVDSFDSRFLKSLKPKGSLLVGQIAAPLPEGDDLRGYDLMVSASPPIVQECRSRGLHAEPSRLAFEPDVLPRLGVSGNPIPVSFVGSVSHLHEGRRQLLESLCKSSELCFWGKDLSELPDDSLLRSRHQGEVWGRGMYRILRDSRMTVNHHIGIAGPHAGNMRLYEATGVGTLLLTDWKEDLHEYFEPGKEVVAYRSPAECAELIRHYSEHEDERLTIARAGQDRTLKEHTFYHRMQELLAVLSKYR
jgi:hypothetical protein